MIATGRSISHGWEKANYDANKVIEDVKVAMELCRHNVYGGNPLEVVEEMRDVMFNFRPNIKKGYFDFVITLSEEDADKVTTLKQGQKIVEEFMRRMLIQQIGLQDMVVSKKVCKLDIILIFALSNKKQQEYGTYTRTNFGNYFELHK